MREFVDIKAFWSLMRMLRKESNVFLKKHQYSGLVVGARGVYLLLSHSGTFICVCSGSL